MDQVTARKKSLVPESDAFWVSCLSVTEIPLRQYQAAAAVAEQSINHQQQYMVRAQTKNEHGLGSLLF